MLAPGQTHDYVSGCELMTNMGSMGGHYAFAREDGSLFEGEIPFFPLQVPQPRTNDCCRRRENRRVPDP